MSKKRVNLPEVEHLGVKYLLILFFILPFSLTCSQVWAQEAAPADAAAPASENQDIEVGLDKVIVLDFDFDTRIVVADSNLVKVITNLAKKEVTLRGLKSGRTSVTIYDTTGERKKNWVVNISATGPSKVVSDLNEFLADVEGLDIRVKAGKVVIQGEIIVPSDIGKLSIILASYPDVINLINLSPQTQRIIARKMQKEIQNAGMKDVTVRVVNGVYWLEGVVSRNEDKPLAMKLAEGYVIDRVMDLSKGSDRLQSAEKKSIIDFITVNPKKDPPKEEKQIKISSQFVELVRDYQKIFGFRWQPFMGTDGGRINIGSGGSGGLSTNTAADPSAGGGGGGLSAVITNLFPKLISAKNAGHARIIQSGMVVAKEGYNANIKKTKSEKFTLGNAGGLAPPTPNDASTGFEMTVKPTVQEGEKIEMDVTIDVTLPAGTGVQGQPSTTTNHVKTDIIVKSKESAVLAGIVLSTNTTAFDKNAPGEVAAGPNGQALFNFQRSKFYVNNKSQFVMFITPEIIESASNETDEIRRKFRRRGR